MTGSGTRAMVLVNSGAYAAQELIAEFGELPPAFLPVGHTRLYELQARLFGGMAVDLCLTLPESFVLLPWDAERLAALGFTVVHTPDSLSLGSALLYALGQLGLVDRPLRVLHGDTVVSGLDLCADDLAAVSEGGDGYRWAEVTIAGGCKVGSISPPDHQVTAVGPRLCGYFAFPSAIRFAETLVLSGGDFYAALNRHAAERSMQAASPGQWLDFGHVQTFFRSRRVVTTERTFNSLEISDLHVRKRSTTATAKLRAEARWLKEVPAAVAPFCARVLTEGEDERGYYYDSEYEYMPTLAELYVFGRLTLPAWTKILGSCGSFMDAASGAGVAPDTPGVLAQLVVNKTADRLRAYAATAGLDLDTPLALDAVPTPSLWQILREIETVLAGTGDELSLMHGDFCFSNILYNFRTDRIRVIDPRGVTIDGGFSLYGDQRYDMAKLMHSICGRYDIILAGHFRGGRTGEHSFSLAFAPEPERLAIETMARSLVFGGVQLGSKVVWATMISLFLSMPPLHADRPERQAAFIANALRLYLLLGDAA